MLKLNKLILNFMTLEGILAVYGKIRKEKEYFLMKLQKVKNVYISNKRVEMYAKVGKSTNKTNK